MMHDRELAVALIGGSLLIGLAVTMPIPAQEKSAKAKPVGVVKATIHLGPFE